jgi:MFS family permease
VTFRDAAPTSRAMVVAVMASMVAFVDSTVINLALPAIEHDLGGGLLLQRWIIDGYLLAMAAAILPGGSISDLFGGGRLLSHRCRTGHPAHPGCRSCSHVMSAASPRG